MPGLNADIVPPATDLEVWVQDLGLQYPPNEGDSDEEEVFSKTFAVDKQ